MTVGQNLFTSAMLDPSQAVPSGLSDPQGRPAGRRFSVYRNNVAVSLTEAAITAFPIITKLVGEEFFRGMAGVYLRQYPPTSPLMMFYGQSFPEFLESFEPVQNLGYLPDIARLELALRESYHAADSTPIEPDQLQALAADELMAAGMTLAPSVRLVVSKWPIYSIWQANVQTDAPAPQMRAEAVLITRPEYDPIPVLLGPAADHFVAALMQGHSFAQAIEAAGDGFDLTHTLGQLLAGGAITKINRGD